MSHKYNYQEYRKDDKRSNLLINLRDLKSDLFDI